MSEQIKFFEKNKMDSTNEDVSLTASQGQDYIEFIRNRSNRSFWMTSGTLDSDNTTIEVDLADARTIDTILLLKHNFKNYTIQYWDGSSYQDFSTPINVTNNTAESTHHMFDAVATTRVLLTILGTMTADDEKSLAQMILTEEIGQFNAWPRIVNPTFDKNKKRTKMLSGKEVITENLGGFSCQLSVEVLKDASDLTLVEAIFDSPEGFLVWLCGGDQTQFSSVRQGYRIEDIFLMRTTGSYEPEFYKGFYKAGLPISIGLVEVTQ